MKTRHINFTLVECLVVIAVIAVLASLLLPTLAKAKDMGRRIACAKNIKQLGQGLAMYVAEHETILQ